MRSHLGDPGFTMKTFRKTLHGTKKKNKINNLVLKKAFRRQLQGTLDNSGDEAVLHNGDAILGAPPDEISYHRKLQACFN